MARNMHCALHKISTDSPNISKAGKDSLSRKYQRQHIFTTYLEDCEESSVPKTNTDSRCAVLACINLEPDGNWRIVALPVQCFNHINLASGINMNGLQHVFSLPLNRLKIDEQRGQRVPLSHYAYSAKSYMERSISGSNLHRRCQHKITNKPSKLNKLSGNSCSQSSLICENSSDLFPDISASTDVNSSDLFMSNSKVDKCVKKNSRKKVRKKGKQSKKQTCDSGSTESEVVPEVYAHVSLSSEVCASNDLDNEDGLMSYAAGPEFSSSDYRLIKNYSKRNVNDASIDTTEAPKSFNSYIDQVEMSEATTPIVQKSAGESDICNSRNQPENRAPALAGIDGKTVDVEQVQLCCYNDMYSKNSSDMQDSLVLDSVSVGSNSEESTNVGDIEKQPNKASCRIGLSNPPVPNSGDGYILGQNLLNGVGSTCNHDESIGHGAQNCSSNDKRVKHKRTMTRNSGADKFGGAGNLHGRTGKENSHSVWQKVQKNDSDESGADLKKINTALSQFDSSLKRPSVRRNGNSVGVDILSKKEDKKHLQNKVGRKSKGKMDLASRKGYCSYSKGTHSNSCILNDNAKVSVQQNGMPNISSQENNQRVLRCVDSCIHSPEVGFQTNRVEQVISESVHSEQVHLEQSDPAKSVCHTISTMKDQDIENWDRSLPMPCDHSNQLSMSEKQSSMCSHLLGDEIGQIEKDVSSATYNGQNYSSGSTLWKWIPIGKKGTGLAFSESDSSLLEYCDELPSKDITLERNVEPKLVSSSQNYVSSLNASRTCDDQICSNSCLDEDENQRLGNQVACTLTEHRDKQLADNHLIYKCENQDAVENGSNKIAKAVNDVCRAQLACDALHVATGSPIAEFERLLHFCSPLICRSPKSLSCLTCSRDHADGARLCRHETPDLSLGSLWQWYEKPGSFGLEIRVQGYEVPKRLGIPCLPFRAYFVPSLSAVQLFKIHKNQCVHSSSSIPNCKVSEAREIGDMSVHTSTASRHPIFSVLFPQPHNQDASITSTNQMHCYEVSSAAAKDDASSPSISSACSGDFELLFEYFESEQPQQRRPLHEKIHELIRGEIPAQSKVYGDPTELDSINLQDLHPRSWYSVAWYPIYRIPDGNLRAAFLTYHSLGHLVSRSTKTELPNADSCIVSPVVGLQSYNSQGECWFQLGHSALTAEMLGLNPSALLKGRLRTLEETASLMSRAVVNKGNLVCTNRHPDYEFFLSRRRF